MPELSQRLAGREIELIMKSDHVLVIRCTDGVECHIGWEDESGKQVPGEPKVAWYGKRIFANTDHIGMTPRRVSGG